MDGSLAACRGSNPLFSTRNPTVKPSIYRVIGNEEMHYSYCNGYTLGKTRNCESGEVGKR
jgi:hypothetical protein